jgi:hypothetical protein
MRSFRKRHLTSAAAVTLLAAWVTPLPPIDPHAVGPAESVDRDANIALLSRAPSRVATGNSHPQTQIVADAASNGGDQVLERWLGLDEQALQRALGPPREQQNRAPAKVSSFRDRACTLYVTLDPDVETRTFHALDYKVISDAHTVKRTRECAAEFSARFSQR